MLAQTHVYWAAIVAGRFAEAYRLHSLDFQERVSITAWRQGARLRQTPRAQSIHWMQRAQRHHGPELYAILDWSGAEAAGRLVWRQEPDGRFLLEKSETRRLPWQ